MQARNIELSILILRVSLGVMFVAHGLLKFVVFTLPGTASFFSQVGFPGWMAYPVAWFELLGGVLLIAGVYSRYVAMVGIPILLGALFTHWANGWVFSNTNGGWEYPLFLIVVSVVVALLGDGAYSARAVTSRNRVVSST